MSAKLPDFIIPIIISSTIVVVGWFVVNFLSWRRTVRERKKELRLTYLITAYENLRLFEEHGLKSYEDFERFRRLLNDIYLFGSLSQIKAVDAIPVGTFETIHVDNLNKLIVKEIREELGLPFYEGKLGKVLQWRGPRNFISQESRFDRLMNCLLILMKNKNLSDMDEQLHDALVEITVLGSREQEEIANKLLSGIEGMETEKVMKTLIAGIKHDLRFQLN